MGMEATCCGAVLKPVKGGDQPWDIGPPQGAICPCLVKDRGSSAPSRKARMSCRVMRAMQGRLRTSKHMPIIMACCNVGHSNKWDQKERLRYVKCLQNTARCDCKRPERLGQPEVPRLENAASASFPCSAGMTLQSSLLHLFGNSEAQSSALTFPPPSTLPCHMTHLVPSLPVL